MDYLKSLSKNDLLDLFAICGDVSKARNLHQYQTCFQNLKTIILFDGGFSVYTEKDAMTPYTHPRACYHMLDIPNELLDTYINGRYYEISSVCQAMFRTWQPLHWKTAWANDIRGNGAKSMRLVMDYGYMDGWACGSYHRENSRLSIFAFAGKKVEKDTRTTAILNFITPHFSESLKEIFNPSLANKKAIHGLKVTPQQLEVLRWVAEGKSTWDISVLLNQSQSDIRKQMDALMHRLDARNRTHAVAIALRKGLIR